MRMPEQSIVGIFEIGVCVMERTREGVFSAVSGVDTKKKS